MLEVDLTLPDGVLVDHHDRALRAALAPTGAIWFAMWSDTLSGNLDVPTQLVPFAGSDVPARQAKPNEGHAKLTEYLGRRVLTGTTGTNCGFCTEKVISDATKFTIAVIYATPRDEARTLLTVNPVEGSNYLFVSDFEAQLSAKDNKNTVDLTLDAALPCEQYRVAMVSCAGADVFLQRNQEAIVHEQGKLPEMSGAADLFIGCRSDRSGLIKTLGGACIADVIVWPDRSVLDSFRGDDIAAREALMEYFHWVYG
jgi:hypothetical protein